MMKQVTVTGEGLKKMKEELDYLKNVRRKEVSDAIGVARSFGDLSENSEYDEAKNEQAKVEAEIAEPLCWMRQKSKATWSMWARL